MAEPVVHPSLSSGKRVRPTPLHSSPNWRAAAFLVAICLICTFAGYGLVSAAGDGLTGGDGSQTVLEPHQLLVMTKTVGTVAGTCATTDEITVTPGATVFYCYQVTNDTEFPLTLHNLVDSELGVIFASEALTLNPGGSLTNLDLGVPVSATVAVTTTNVATWTAIFGEVGQTATDSAVVNVPPEPTALDEDDQPGAPDDFLYLPMITMR